MTRLAITIVAAMLLASVVAAWAAVPRHREPVVDRFAVVEVNRLYNEQAALVFTQLIWLDEGGVVVAWRLVKGPSMLPVLDRRTGEYVVTWLDGETMREVRAKQIKETFTQCHDPEVAQRAIIPPCQRRELTKVGVR